MPDDPEHLEGVIAWKRTTDSKKLVTVILLTFSRARINLGSACGAFYSSGW